VSVANGVVYAGSNSGEMYALEATTGNILWNFASGGTVIDGPSIVEGALYWESGYQEIAGTGNNKVFAFALADEKDRGEHSGDRDHSHDKQ
jgi:polyvinyl alcohol dehydrogenase (cytochrome)